MARSIAFMHVEFPAGGAETITTGISRCMLDKGDKVYIFVKRFKEEKLSPEHEGIEIIRLPAERYDSKENAQFVVEEADRLGIDVIIFPVSILHMMKYIKERSRAKVIFSLHSVPMWEAQVYEPERMRKAYRKGGLSVAMWHVLKRPFIKLFKNPKRRFTAKYKYVFDNSHAVTVLVDDYKKQFEKIVGSGPQDDRIFVTPNFLLNRNIELSRPKEKAVLFVGRLTYSDKRVDHLIDVWDKVYKDFPEWQLWIVGDGEERAYLERSVKERDIKRVSFIPYTPNPYEYYTRASILALTSHLEGWGMVISEAQQAGVVPIAYGCSQGVTIQIEPEGVNGMIVTPFDKKEFEDKLRRLMGDEQLLKSISRNVVKKAEDYGVESACTIWDDLFDKLMSK